MKEKKFNGWSIYWIVLLIINFGAYIFSLRIGDFSACIISGFMVLFCSIALRQNMLAKSEEE
jgi:hypothetical protein